MSKATAVAVGVGEPVSREHGVIVLDVTTLPWARDG